MKKRQRYVTLPSDWDELEPADWRELLRMRQQMIDKGLQLTVGDVRIETARMLLKNRGVKTQVNNQQYLVLLSQIADGLDWLWKEEDGGLSLTLRTCRQLMPKIQHGKDRQRETWVGPMDFGQDILFGEFRMAIALMKEMNNPEQTATSMQALAGLLYRPAATDEQKQAVREWSLVRQPYDWDTISEKIERGGKMKPWQVWGIYAWFAYFCEALTTEDFTVEGEDVCFRPLFSDGDGEGVAKSGGKGGSLSQICHTLAESHVFGTARDVDRTPLFSVMLKLLHDYQALIRMKQQMKKGGTR